MAKKALITGITGQDGSYLAEFLLDKGYEVHGIKRRSSSFNTSRLDHIYENPHQVNKRLFLHYGDLSDSSNLTSIIEKIKPDEIYNLGAQSHVAVSFESPEYTADINGIGTLRILDSIRLLGLSDRTRFYQASTSELFGKVKDSMQNEETQFYPRSPYAVAKLFSYWITINYREAYGIYACNGLLFNHESPRRGETFVTRKITRGLCNIVVGLEECLYMGNIDSKRDWGHARDYVEMQWLMLQQETAKDYVVATGEQYTVRQFISWACESLGIKIEFNGKGVNEVGTVKKISSERSSGLKAGQVIVRIDERYFRPTEVETLLGDSSKAQEELGWKPKTTVVDMCREMIEEDFKIAKSNLILDSHGLKNSSLISRLHDD